MVKVNFTISRPICGQVVVVCALIHCHAIFQLARHIVSQQSRGTRNALELNKRL